MRPIPPCRVRLPGRHRHLAYGLPVDLASTVWDRLTPVAAGTGVTGGGVLLACAVAVAVCVVPVVWRWVRLAVTLVHELGHAGVGMLVGRRFTGFVVRGDMSGHAVTSGRPTGLGRVVTTWVGYPMPGLVGAALLWAAGSGYAAPTLTVLLVGLLAVLARVRSAGTLLTVVVSLGTVGAAWWWRSDGLQAQLLVGFGVVLVVGAWRHLGAVLGGGHPRGAADVSDPGVLRRLTGIPRMLWTGSYVLVLAAVTWFSITSIAGAVSS